MKVLTNNDNVIIAISNIATIDETTRNIALDNYNIAYAPNEQPNIYDVEVEEGVTEQKYCYTEADGFYKNPNYIAPPKPIEEQITDIEMAVAELGEIILGGAE